MPVSHRSCAAAVPRSSTVLQILYRHCTLTSGLNCGFESLLQGGSSNLKHPCRSSHNLGVSSGCRYFSYEHFYVIYCKFWELDSDHDFLIDKEDLLRYGNHALTYRIVDRIFAQVWSGRLFCLVGLFFEADENSNSLLALLPFGSSRSTSLTTASDDISRSWSFFMHVTLCAFVDGHCLTSSSWRLSGHMTLLVDQIESCLVIGSDQDHGQF